MRFAALGACLSSFPALVGNCLAPLLLFGRLVVGGWCCCCYFFVCVCDIVDVVDVVDVVAIATIA